MGKTSKDKRDAYYRLAKEQGWRARSAFKLLQLDEEFDLFNGVTRVVDLCAAPGSWSQVLSRVLIKGEKFGRTAWQDREASFRQQMLKVFPSGASDVDQPMTTPASATSPGDDVKIVSIDLQPISPLPGVVTLRADITHPATVPLLLKALDPDYDATSQSKNAAHPVDLVISDGAPDVTGLHDLDIYVQSQLLFAALNLALCVLRPGGKSLSASPAPPAPAASRPLSSVSTSSRRPASRRASRNPLGVGHHVPAMVEERKGPASPSWPTRCTRTSGTGVWDGVPTATSARLGSDVMDVEAYDDVDETSDMDKNIRWIAPFIACGDLSAFDSDASYQLPEDHVSLDPVQPPTAPPYKRALEMRKVAGGAYGKTTIKS
ncbi:tRNA (uridine-2'-O-)-methyltransferase TRM7 [Verticillium dahliae VdLs.17]|uniref:tRNA (Uridine-2'-O-)-methyltransferase TRM7 n=1 Tax=Verticillium dahliae (strain VdLs.17 / ATCC MYA-4575 / FGSC 10137) TaxID=498257 RepID=G2X5D1_VERDV|nr:tRNA (uridine-2'-O-)-methyltransferase TRM7 [Verticillium dahliae VdLs.17]EGY14272.1 tRNA (uridine-2'-O-)-methyltransferase TRM7 [Verticillium dahliae VdLs.17]